MQLLVAQEFAPGRFSKVAFLKRGRNGWSRIPAHLHGSLWTFWARQAADFFAAEPAARTVFYEQGTIKCRIDLIK